MSRPGGTSQPVKSSTPQVKQTRLLAFLVTFVHWVILCLTFVWQSMNRSQQVAHDLETHQTLPETGSNLFPSVKLEDPKDYPCNAIPPLENSYSVVMKVKISEYDGTTDWQDYYCQFRAIAEYHKWSDQDRLLKLVSNLKGVALAVYGNYPDATYTELVKRLADRFSPAGRVPSFERAFWKREMRPSEEPEEYAQKLEQLACRAYPTTSVKNLEDIVVRQYIKGLPNDGLLEYVFLSEPDTLTSAVTYTHRYLTLQDMKGKSTYRSSNQNVSSTTIPTENTETPKCTLPQPGDTSPSFPSHPSIGVPDPIQIMLGKQQKILESLQTQLNSQSRKCSSPQGNSVTPPVTLMHPGTPQVPYAFGNPSLMSTYHATQQPSYPTPSLTNPYWGTYPQLSHVPLSPVATSAAVNHVGSPPPGTDLGGPDSRPLNYQGLRL